MKAIVIAAALAAAVAGPGATAGTLAPIHAASIDLGTTRGSAYYVVAADGYHLVATLQSGRASTPIRFNAVLSDGQSASVSIPGPADTSPTEVTFTRTADHLVVRQSTDAADEIATQ